VTTYHLVEGDGLARVVFQAEGWTLSQAGVSLAAELASGLALMELIDRPTIACWSSWGASRR
jgi:hypothetical protein